MQSNVETELEELLGATLETCELLEESALLDASTLLEMWELKEEEVLSELADDAVAGTELLELGTALLVAALDADESSALLALVWLDELDELRALLELAAGSELLEAARLLALLDEGELLASPPPSVEPPPHAPRLSAAKHSHGDIRFFIWASFLLLRRDLFPVASTS